MTDNQATFLSLGLFAAFAGGAVLLALRLKESSSADTETSVQSDTYKAPPLPDSIDAWITQNYSEIETNNVPTPPPPVASDNIAAMLQTIAKCEGTADKSDPYHVCYAYKHTIASLQDHPAITGEWTGEKLSVAMCAGAGYGPGCVSTAAGKYQIIKPTWQRIKRKLNLPDFSPESQDAAAIELLRERGALAPLARGDIEAAVFAARKEWASLKGAGYGQGERSLSWITARFVEAGGVLT